MAAQSRDEPEPYSLPGDDDQRHALREVALGRLVDRHLLAARQVHRPRSLRSRHEQVPQPHVRERAAHHHLVVAAPRAVRVEVLTLDAVLDEVLAGRGVRLDRAGRRDVVGRHRVADHDEAARARRCPRPARARVACPRSTAAGARTSSPGSQANRSPSGTGSSRHAGSPVNTSAYVRVNISPRTAREIVSWISSALGQRSRR